MKNISVELTNLGIDTQDKNFQSLLQQSKQALETLKERTGKGNDFLGWLDLPEERHSSIFSDVLQQANRISKISDVVVVVGIGGSYLGSRAVLDGLNHHFQACKLRNKENPLVVYAGNNLSSSYLSDLMEILDDKEYSIIVISKSGTTTEPAVAFRILRNHLLKKYGKSEASRRVWAITDAHVGALKELADQEKYPQFVVPDNVGGRYSVLTPVGLLPIAAGGVDIDALMKGAEDMKQVLMSDLPLEDNPALRYVAARNYLYQNDKKIEVMVNYEPSMQQFAEWWKQLFGESEGKEHKGIFPASVNNTADLHSMGQYIQEGERHLFETLISFEDRANKVFIPSDEANLDRLNYIADKSVDYVNQMAEKGTIMAHEDGGVPTIRFSVPEKSAYYLGQLIFLFEVSCAVSGYVLGVNPFDQPGVEAYKKNMFALLGKEGYTL